MKAYERLGKLFLFSRVTTCLCLSIHLVYGQLPQPAQDVVNRNLPKPVPGSPNVASLGKFGDYQVSHFTGLPDISIPIFEVKSGELTVPITLSYHASGVKPTDLASWVGMGWALKAGGQVSRTINGKQDEEHYSGNPLKTILANCGGPGTGTFYYLRYAATGVTDTEPDIFSYSYPGGSGKFIKPYGETPYIIPYAPIQITPAVDRYEIVDERGVLYRFGKNSGNVIATESSTTYHGGNPAASGITTWHLMEMIAPNSDDQISFTFQDVGVANTQDVAYTYALMDLCTSTNGASCPTTIFSPQVASILSSVVQKGNQTIFFETGKVEFVLSSSNRSDAPQLKWLDRIEIYNKVNGSYNIQKTVKFLYTYFTNAVGGSAALKLDALQFKDNAGATVQEYRFSYWTNSFSWNPSLTSFWNARDLWGYYNGATQNTDLVLQQTVSYQDTPSTPAGNVSFGGAVDRNVNATYVKEGVLSRIDFPTGGFTEFDYESNKYLDGTVKLAGGLRVTRITTKESVTSPTIIKTYKYGIGESGYGIANFNTLQFNFSTSQHYYSPDCGTINPYLDYRIRTFHSNSAFSQDPMDASPVRYTTVTEYVGDPAGARLGKVIYEFDDAGDTDHVVPGSGKFFRNSFAWKRGKLKSKIVYDSSNQKLSETQITYTTYKLTNAKYVGIGVHENIPGAPGCAPSTCTNEVSEWVSPQTYLYMQYYQSTGAHLQTQVKEYLYERGNVNNFTLTQTDNVFEANKAQLKQSTVRRSNGDDLITVNTYPFELTANASSTSTAKGIYKLNTKNIVSAPVETFTYTKQGANEQVISGQVTTFLECAANTNYVVPDKVYILESTLPVIKTSYTPVSINGTNNGVTMNGAYKERINMVAYDNAGNIQTVAKTDDARVTYLWSYSNARPVAQIANADLNVVAYSSFESDGKGNWSYAGTPSNNTTVKTGAYYYPLTGGNITRSLPAGTYKLEYWAKAPVTLSGGTITDIRTSAADANGWILYEKQVVMAATTTLTLSGTTYIDELRVYPMNAQMTTYTYDPLYGITSVTDTNNFTTYYEYDTFGRLKFVKDKDHNIVKAHEYKYKIN